MTTLLLSDLHLPAQPSRLREAFVEFLEGPAREARQVFILGDLFEYWIGDDVGLRIYAREISRIAALTASGVEVFFMAGNRDFMVGKSFAEISGAKILPDPTVLMLNNGPALLSHGEAPRNAKLPLAEHAAWTQVATLLLNLSETISRN